MIKKVASFIILLAFLLFVLTCAFTEEQTVLACIGDPQYGIVFSRGTWELTPENINDWLVIQPFARIEYNEEKWFTPDDLVRLALVYFSYSAPVKQVEREELAMVWVYQSNLTPDITYWYVFSSVIVSSKEPHALHPCAVWQVKGGIPKMEG